MKGQILWSVINIVITTVIIVFGISVLFSGIDARVETDQALRSQEMASIINLIQNAPDGTSHEYRMPRVGCDVSIDINFVHVKMGDNSNGHSSPIVRSLESIEQKTFKCSEEDETIVTFMKDKGRLTITTSGIEK